MGICRMEQGSETRKDRTALPAVLLSSAAFAASSFQPGAAGSLILLIVAASLLAFAIPRSQHPYRDSFGWGIVFNLIAFYWLPDTITVFGGFPRSVSFALFAVFAVVSSLQLLFFAFLYIRLKGTLVDKILLAVPLAWLVSEFLVPRMFPWSFAHPVIGLQQISGLAEYVGVYPLSAVILWWGGFIVYLVQLVFRRADLRPAFIACVFLVNATLFICGQVRLTSALEEISAAPQTIVALVQGNLEAHQTSAVPQYKPDLETYIQLSQQAESQGAELLIWPESVLDVWTPEPLRTVRGTRYDPYPGNPVPLLYGTLAYRERSAEKVDQFLRSYPHLAGTLHEEAYRYLRFNSAYAIDQRGKVLGAYHKRALMPFGEYLPFADLYPALRTLSPNTGDLSIGDLRDPIVIPLGGARTEAVRAGMLICYEDLVSSLARDEAVRGANLLVNLTNDVWYGKSKAPYQHHLLASWRAVETRRFLLRATNTGYTGIVDPFGRTAADLPIFETGLVTSRVNLLESRTLYSRIGDLPVWLLTGAALLFLLKRRKK